MYRELRPFIRNINFFLQRSAQIKTEKAKTRVTNLRELREDRKKVADEIKAKVKVLKHPQLQQQAQMQQQQAYRQQAQMQQQQALRQRQAQRQQEQAYRQQRQAERQQERQRMRQFRQPPPNRRRLQPPQFVEGPQGEMRSVPTNLQMLWNDHNAILMQRQGMQITRRRLTAMRNPGFVPPPPHLQQPTRMPPRVNGNQPNNSTQGSTPAKYNFKQSRYQGLYQRMQDE